MKYLILFILLSCKDVPLYRCIDGQVYKNIANAYKPLYVPMGGDIGKCLETNK